MARSTWQTMERWAMFKGFTTTGVLAATLAVAGCASYRPEPLSPSVELRSLQERTPERALTTAERSTPLGAGYHPEDGLDEAELVMAALSFNPALRERRYEMSHLGDLDLFGMVRFKPEMQVSLDRATIGLAGDSDMLYTLLVPSLRQAWRDDEAARREQTRAEMLAAEAQVVADVRRAHVAVLAGHQRVGWAQQRVEHRRGVLDQVQADPRATPLDRAVATLAWERALADHRRDIGELAEARRGLNRLVGFDPQADVRLSAADQSLVGRITAGEADEQLDQQLLNGRWELKALEASYRRAEYTYSHALVGEYPKLRLAPAVTYDRDEGTSLKFGASLRIPWPEDAYQKAEDALKERDRARAVYLARLHDLRASAHAANARLARAAEELIALEHSRSDATALRQESEARRAAGELSLVDYLPLIAQCEEIARAWIAAAQDYRLARIDLDHATGRLNRITDVRPAP